MNTPKHTPGKWEIHGKNASGEILIGKQGEKYNTGKIVRVGWNCCGKDSQEWEANARLIAAAPDLLEALRKAEVAISYLQQKFVTMEKEHDHAAMMSGHARRTIREAINKAIGE